MCTLFCKRSTVNCPNNFVNVSQPLSCILFAGDSNLFYSNKNIGNLIDIVNIDLALISNFFNNTNGTLFSYYLHSVPKDIFVDNNKIATTECSKCLGLYVDNKLSWIIISII